MKVTERNIITNATEGSVTLTKNNFLASGGEGSIYVSGNFAYKIFTDKSKMTPRNKMVELCGIADQRVIRPLAVVTEKDIPVGYKMKFVSDTRPLVTTFTKAFRDRNNITNDVILDLVSKFRTVIESVHAGEALVVDLNEMNFLVAKKFDDIYAIDTDSYQTKSFHPTAIMDSIRDRHAKTFTKETDWFSFGILTFQMFIGIHPYRGKHQTYKTVDERMIHNISVLSTDVSIPKVCNDFSFIPDTYLQWYKAIFNEGKRIAPPNSYVAPIIHVAAKVVHASKKLIIDLLKGYDSPVIDMVDSRVLTHDKLYHGNRTWKVSDGVKLCRTASGTILLAKIDGGLLKLYNPEAGSVIETSVMADVLMTYNSSLYMKSGSNILMLDVIETPKNIIASAKVVATVLERSAHVYDGVIVQDLVGACYLSIFNKPGQHSQVHLKEFDGVKVVDAKYMNNVLVMITYSAGKYNRNVIRFDSGCEKYDIRTVTDVAYTGINFSVLDTGVCILVDENESFEVFFNKIGNDKILVVEDPAIDNNMRLIANGSKMNFSRGNELFSVSLKG